MQSLSTQEIIDLFERDGVVLIERLLQGPQLAAAQQGVDWAMAQKPERYQWIRQRTYEWLQEHPVFVEIIEHPLVIDFATTWLGDDCHLIAAQCSRNTKQAPYISDLTQLHQDDSFFPPLEQRNAEIPDHKYGFSAMWYMQDTPLMMGPTEFVLGSQTLNQNSVSNAGIKPDALFRKAIPAGSLILFNHRTWHRGAVNLTNEPRDLITNAYARPEVGKVQLTTPQPDGSHRYISCPKVITQSPVLRDLLRERSLTPP